MNNRLYFALSICSIILLSLLVIVGTIQLIENTKDYGFSYEVITITSGVETRVTMSLWINVAFLVFLSVVIYLLAIPLTSYYQNMKKEKEENDAE